VLERESAPWGRAPKLIAVTKYSAPEEILPLAGMGVFDIGENRVQAIRDKLPHLHGKFSIHLIGRLQSNKVKYIINDVCMIHSLDRLELAREIDRQAQKNGKRIPVLIQVTIAREPQKGGVEEEGLMPFLRACAPLPGLEIKGLMAMMPLGAERDALLGYFSRMRALLDQCRQEAIPGTDMTELSMGMSQDYDLAARCGATMVRVGSALFR
jgi:pyridoxal phosphate enzyme (YggS family)